MPEAPTSTLAALRVLDLSDGVAGAYCTKLFADYGADVVAVEPPGCGHPLRRHGPFPDDAPRREAGGGQRTHQRQLHPPGGLQDHQRRLELLKTRHQFSDTPLIVGDMPAIPDRSGSDVQPLLGHIDPDVDIARVHFLLLSERFPHPGPSLQDAGSSAPATVRALAGGRGVTTQLSDGLAGPRMIRPVTPHSHEKQRTLEPAGGSIPSPVAKIQE